MLSHNPAYSRCFAHILPEGRAIFINIRDDFLRAFVLAAGISGCSLLATVVARLRAASFTSIVILSTIFSLGFFLLFYIRYRARHPVMRILINYTRAFNLLFLFIIGIILAGLYYMVAMHVLDAYILVPFSKIMLGSALLYVLLSSYSSRLERTPNFIFLLLLIPCLSFIFYLYLYLVQLFLLGALWLVGELP
jgi:hypothetical protein